MSKAPGLEAEKELWAMGFENVCCLDEVGRGALAGPVTMGAVLVIRDASAKGVEEVRDSKLLSKKKREDLLLAVKAWAPVHAVASASSLEVDELGMTKALQLASLRAIKEIVSQGVVPDKILLDGSHDYIGKPWDVKTIIKGDMSSLGIASASILAKTSRDFYMTELGKAHPEYFFEKNMGYGSSEHQKALKENGLLKEHRRSWSFAREILSPQMTFDDLLL